MVSGRKKRTYLRRGVQSQLLVTERERELLPVFNDGKARQGTTHQEETNNVPPSIPAERSLRRKRLQQGRPGDGQDEVEEPGGRRGQRHTDRPDVQWVCLCRVRKGHRAFTGRIYDPEEVYPQCNAGNPSLRVVWDPEAESGEEYYIAIVSMAINVSLYSSHGILGTYMLTAEGHEWECSQKQVPSTECVDGCKKS